LFLRIVSERESALSVLFYLLWWLVICNGNAAILVAFVNRTHGFRFPEWLIHLSHKVHYLLLVGVPAGVFLATGWYGPRLIRGGSWQDLPPIWWLAFAVFGLGTLRFWWSVTWRILRPVPRQQLSIQSQHVDIRQELGRPPIGNGPYSWMAMLPGNEIFQLEIHQREFLIPRLPAAWDGLSILHFSDVHFIGTVDIAYFQKVVERAQDLQADMICFTGDLFDDPKLLPWFAETFDRLQAPLGRFFILGNHDWQLETEPIRQELTRLGWLDVSAGSQTLERAGQQIVLKGSEYPWMGQNPSFQDCRPDALRILLSHTPDNIGAARQQQVDLMLSGHNHGGQVRLPLIGPVYCPSRYGCYYAEGIFWEPPTLLHISRGIAGRHPLRYGCPPEITKIVLRSPTEAGNNAGE
jgi:predicted MPP superfamily phosphohydrolase